MRRQFGTTRRVLVALVLASAAVAGASLVSGCSSSGTSGGAAAGSAQVPRAGGYAGNESAGGSSSGGAAKTNVADAQSLIVVAGLQLAVKDPDQAASSAEQTALAAGGYVAGETEGMGTQVLPSANITADAAVSGVTGVSPLTLPSPDAAAHTEQALLLLRVPPARLADVLASLSGKGSVAYRTQSETDVTGQVADVNSRVASARAAIAELRGMIDKAASMNDLISLEQALASRESDLESLEAQQRALADQVAYATVTVGFFVPAGPVATPAAQHRNPFAAGLTDSWHALIALGRALLAAAGWLLPFLVIIALLWWPVRRLARGWRRRHPVRAAE